MFFANHCSSAVGKTTQVTSDVYRTLIKVGVQQGRCDRSHFITDLACGANRLR
jgi:hypothetical protein